MVGPPFGLCAIRIAEFGTSLVPTNRFPVVVGEYHAGENESLDDHLSGGVEDLVVPRTGRLHQVVALDRDAVEVVEREPDVDHGNRVLALVPQLEIDAQDVEEIVGRDSEHALECRAGEEARVALLALVDQVVVDHATQHHRG